MTQHVILRKDETARARTLAFLLNQGLPAPSQPELFG